MTKLMIEGLESRLKSTDVCVGNDSIFPVSPSGFKTPFCSSSHISFTFTLKMKDYGQNNVVYHHNCGISILFSFTINKNVGLE